MKQIIRKILKEEEDDKQERFNGRLEDLVKWEMSH